MAHIWGDNTLIKKGRLRYSRMGVTYSSWQLPSRYSFSVNMWYSLIFVLGESPFPGRGGSVLLGVHLWCVKRGHAFHYVNPGRSANYNGETSPMYSRMCSGSALGYGTVKHFGTWSSSKSQLWLLTSLQVYIGHWFTKILGKGRT